MTMKKLFLFFTLLSALAAGAQETKELQEHARAYMRQGDYDNATLLLIKALEQSPNDLSVSKDLALNYYFQKENNKALEIIKPVQYKTGSYHAQRFCINSGFRDRIRFVHRLQKGLFKIISAFHIFNNIIGK